MDINSTDIESLFVLKTTLPASIMWIVLGILAAVSSCLLLITLKSSTKRKKETSNFYYNVGFLAFADLFVGLSLLGVGLKRVCYAANDMSSAATPLRCSVDQGAIIFGMQASVTQTLCLSTDRLIAVLFPLYYRNEMSPKMSRAANYILLSLSAIVTTLGSVVGLRDTKLIPACTQTAVYNEPFYQFFTSLMLIYSLVIIGEYGAILLKIRISLCKAIREKTDVKEVKTHLQTHILASMEIVVAIYIATWLFASIGADILSWLIPFETSMLIIPYLIALTGVNSAVNFLIYLWKNEDIRKDFLNVFQRQAHITPISLIHTV